MIITDIVIVDSGVNFDQSVLKDDNIEGIRLSFENNNVELSEDFNDSYGHGTAVYNIIRKHSPSSKIFNIKIFNDDFIEEINLISALRYIKENILCKVINLSFGLKLCIDIKELREICSELVLSGKILVSAFDNDGCYSFPAAFDNVIGVDSSYECKSPFDFEFVEGSPVNVRAKGGLQRVMWNNGRNIVLGGASFACAYMSSYIVELIKEKSLSFNEILEKIKSSSKRMYPERKYIKTSDDFFRIKKAAVFPFNKEMHSLVRFSDKLTFEIADIYDIRQSGRVGANIKKLIDITESDLERDFTIKDIQEIDYEAVDTVIIGHVEELNRMLKKDIRQKIILNAVENKVNVFSFDSLDYCAELFNNRESKVYYPEVNMADVPQNSFGKLYNISKPVLAVFGTSSKQGKFSLQVILKKLLENFGYKVGSIGTEPHSLLFGADYVYPMGYNSAILIDDHSSVLTINNLIYNLCDAGSEIIITGSQSNSIPNNFMNVSVIPVKQHAFLLGVQPDAVILCINPDDNITYIYNTIKYLEGTTNCKVISLVMFPMKIYDDWRGVFDVKEKISKEELKLISSQIRGQIKLPLFELADEADMSALCDLIVDFF